VNCAELSLVDSCGWLWLSLVQVHDRVSVKLINILFQTISLKSTLEREYEARHTVCFDFKKRNAIWLNIRKYVHEFVKAAGIVHNKQNLLKSTLTDLF